MKVESEEFLGKLSELLQVSNANKSSVYFTQKRYKPYDEIDGKSTTSVKLPNNKASIDNEDKASYAIIMRVTNGAKDKSKRIKYSTVIQPEDLAKFWKEYTNVMKSGIVGLKKKSKKKKKKATGGASGVSK